MPVLYPFRVFRSLIHGFCLGMIFCPDCPSLPSFISHGFVNGTGSVEGSRHRFSCDEGYSLVGQHTLYCGKDGSWNGSVPTCLIGIVDALADKSSHLAEMRLRVDQCKVHMLR